MNRSDGATENILSYLPDESLVKLKTTMSNLRFHVRRYKCQPQNQFMIWGNEQYTDTLTQMRLENGIFQIKRNPVKLPKPALPLCSTNGIILMKTSDGDHHHFSLLNPTVSASDVRFYSQKKIEDFSISYGHYYNPSDDDYNVVIVSRRRFGEEEYSVFSCRDKIWSKKKPFLQHRDAAGLKIDREKGVFVDGCFYWWVREDRKLVSFDVRDGRWHKSPGPSELSGRNEEYHKIKLTELTGRLCLYRKSIGPRDWLDLQVWVLEKEVGYTNVADDQSDGEDWFGKWRMLIKFLGENPVRSLPSTINNGIKDSVVCFLNETLPPSRFFLYDDQQNFYNQVRCNVNHELYHHVIPYSESLFFPFH